jgi:hypothetical protein
MAHLIATLPMVKLVEEIHEAALSCRMLCALPKPYTP